MITITLKELDGVMRGIGAVMGQKIPVLLAYRISKLVKSLTDEAQNREKLRVKICEDFCDKDAKNNSVIKDGKYTGLEGNGEFEKAISELYDMTINIDFEPLCLSMLEKSGVTLTCAEVISLDKFITE